MALHRTPAEHDANPPSTWTVVRIDCASSARWGLTTADGMLLDSFSTRKAAEAAKVDGSTASLYEKEGRWFAGEHVHPWIDYADMAS